MCLSPFLVSDIDDTGHPSQSLVGDPLDQARRPRPRHILSRRCLQLSRKVFRLDGTRSDVAERIDRNGSRLEHVIVGVKRYAAGFVLFRIEMRG